ncbi:MAG: hypoxanthine phosphoribosyltransferase [Bacteroidales bacterium]|jgi:hypoxanthine phosphoribosyltransferase|nr:hypoxanthine phosphoribosyltransferase [Bacteroidales bacterium]
MNKLKIRDKIFEVYLEEKEILAKVSELAQKIENDYSGKEILFISILNGSFVFTADLLRNIDMNVKLSFMKLTSYEGLASTGNVRRLIGVNEDIKNKTVIILEDIIDTGKTLDGIIEDLYDKGAKEIRVAALLLKPAAYSGSYKIDYLGFEIPNDFVIGYGLDWDGLGRNLRSIYRIAGEGDKQ